MPSTAPPSPRTLMNPLTGWALFLDFDGTLVELAATPAAIQIPIELSGLLHALARVFDGALAVLTGRSLADLDGYLQGLRLPAAGQHGAELRRIPDGGLAIAEAQALATLRPEIAAFAKRRPEVTVEDKGACIALHYRASPAAEAVVAERVAAWVAASGGALEALAGKAVRELRPTGVNKGRALAALLAAPPFAGRRPLVLGDDVTDEAAIAMAIARGGTAIKVGEGASRAPWRLADPTAVRTWLARLLL